MENVTSANDILVVGKRPQIILLGNGLNQTQNSESWNDLLKTIKDADIEDEYNELESPMTLRTLLLTNDDILKKVSAYYLQKQPISNKLIERILDLPCSNILTTNYSYEIENTIKPGITIDNIKKSMTSLKQKADQKYMLSTFNQFDYHGHQKRIWHIHGEARKYSSIVLTHDSYGRLLSRYIDMISKRGFMYKNWYNMNFPYVSWLDYFILGDVYILGLGLDYSENDLWWLIERKYKEKAPIGKIYYYNYAEYKGEKEITKEKHKILERLGCEVKTLECRKENEKFNYEEFYEKAITDIEHLMKING